MNAIITGVVVLVGLLLVLEAVVWHFPQFVGWIIGFFGALYFLILYLRLGLQIDMVFAVVASIVFLLIVEPFLWRVFASLKVGLGPGMYQQSRSPRLNMGRINYYTVIIPRLMLWSFLKRGWQQDFCFSGFLYRARLWQTVVIGRPATLINLDPKTLIGQRITAFDVSYGNYGMGGPGFFGITLSEQPEDHKVLVYAVWNAASYILFDGRMFGAQWLAQNRTSNTDNRGPVLIGCQITDVELYDDHCYLYLMQGTQTHTIKFVHFDERLEPQVDGKPRQDASEALTIGNYLVFQHEYGTLWV